MQLADRMLSIPFSEIREVFEEVTRRERHGEKIIHLEIGRPDFDTPKNIKEAAKSALDEGKVHYTSNYGLPELRKAISKKLERDNHLFYDSHSEIIVTVGVTEGILLSMMALLNPGDEAMIPTPCFPHYFHMVRMAGATPVPFTLIEENGFEPDLEKFQSAITPKTKMLIINSPNNPTGSVLDDRVLEGLADIAYRKNLIVVSDEIYEKMVYDGCTHISIAAMPGMKERTVVLNGFSKTYAMTGWRLGYLAGSKELVSAMIRIILI